MKEINVFLNKNSDIFYGISRIIVGLIFFLHGYDKLVTKSIPIMSQYGFAGLLEFVGGLMILVGFLTRYTAIVLAIEMLVAYFVVHIPNGFNPLTNGGEAALLYFAAFLYMIAKGAPKASVDCMIATKK